MSPIVALTCRSLEHIADLSGVVCGGFAKKQQPR